MRKIDYDQVLDSTEQVALQMFIDNEVQFNAVRKVLEFKLREVGNTKRGDKPIGLEWNFAFQLVSNSPDTTNEKLGENLRAQWEGARIIQNAFDDLMFYKKEEKVAGKEKNPAR